MFRSGILFALAVRIVAAEWSPLEPGSSSIPMSADSLPVPLQLQVQPQSAVPSSSINPTPAAAASVVASQTPSVTSTSANPVLGASAPAPTPASVAIGAATPAPSLGPASVLPMITSPGGLSSHLSSSTVALPSPQLPLSHTSTVVPVGGSSLMASHPTGTSDHTPVPTHSLAPAPSVTDKVPAVIHLVPSVASINNTVVHVQTTTASTHPAAVLTHHSSIALPHSTSVINQPVTAVGHVASGTTHSTSVINQPPVTAVGHVAAGASHSPTAQSVVHNANGTVPLHHHLSSTSTSTPAPSPTLNDAVFGQPAPPPITPVSVMHHHPSATATAVAVSPIFAKPTLEQTAPPAMHHIPHSQPPQPEVQDGPVKTKGRKQVCTCVYEDEEEEQKEEATVAVNHGAIGISPTQGHHPVAAPPMHHMPSAHVPEHGSDESGGEEPAGDGYSNYGHYGVYPEAGNYHSYHPLVHAVSGNPPPGHYGQYTHYRRHSVPRRDRNRNRNVPQAVQPYQFVRLK